MKTMLSFVALMVALVTGVLGGCGQAAMTYEQSKQWIAAFPGDTLNDDQTICIEWTDSLRQLLPDTLALHEAWEIEPQVEGSLKHKSWGLSFEPVEGALVQGQHYRCQLHLARLTGVDSLGVFECRFYVRPRQVEMRQVAVRLDSANIDRVVVEGELRFNTKPQPEHLARQCFWCDAGGFELQCFPTANEHVVRFRYGKLDRGSSSRTVQFAYRAAGFSEQTAQLEVPARGQLRVLGVKLEEGAEPCVVIDFAQPLATDQDLEGLVAVEDVEPLRLEREGSQVRFYFARNGLSELVVKVSGLIRSESGQRLEADVVERVEQEPERPQVEIPLSGTILPDGDNLRLPFRTVNLAAVDVRVVKTYTQNLLSFLQLNDLADNAAHCSMQRYGRLIYRHTLRLDADSTRHLHQWQQHWIDLRGLFRREPGALYTVYISYADNYSLVGRTQAAAIEPLPQVTPGGEEPGWGYYDYGQKSYHLVASHLGLIVKHGEGQEDYLCAVNDLRSTAPMADVCLTAYNYQLRPMGSARTDEQGFATLRLRERPFVVTASDGQSTTYLKIAGQQPRSTSRFDVGGRRLERGVKGFVYGERGVWRPGDEVHLTLMVEDSQHALPERHPATVELYTPTEQLYARHTLTQGIDGIYAFCIPTAEDAPTGCWQARFKVGGHEFRHLVRIETIKPNRLKLHIDAPAVLQASSSQQLGLAAHWLTGPAAQGLNCRMDLELFAQPFPFPHLPGYRFANPLFSHSRSEQCLFSGVLDSVGTCRQTATIPATQQSPGPMQACLVARVAEGGGDESLTSASVCYSPYGSYAGIQLGEAEFVTDTDLKFPVVVVGPSGELVHEAYPLEYKVYKLGWSWWMEGSAQRLSRYVQSSEAEVVAGGRIVTSAEGKAEVPFRVDYPEWGRYLVLVRDLSSGHTTGGQFVIDWPQWRGRASKKDPTAATMLSFALDKKSYQVGDQAVVYLPQAEGGRALISVEDGSHVISRQWVSLSGERETAHRLRVTRQMAPNFYVHATLLQPHARTAHDQPIRLYGIEGAEVNDPASRLLPVITAPQEVEPEQEFCIRVSEEKGRPMSYTLAVVDEGLLDVTAFRTPDPWRAMNQRQALGVDTWDMYDDVVGAFAGRFHSILSIGGDEALRSAAGKEKRFRPVVKCLGPFRLEGGTRTHRIRLPMYVGSVRVMVVAARGGSYGHAEHTMAVRAPLMLLPTVPRTLASGDSVVLPVNVFHHFEGKNVVRVEAEATGPATLIGPHVQQLSLEGKGEQLATFRLSCHAQQSGQARIVVRAQSGTHRVADTVWVDVANPQPRITTVERIALADGQERIVEWQGQAQMQLSTMPSIHFGGAFGWLEHYAHQCSEQLSAQAFFMLYARQFLADSCRLRAEQMLPRILHTLMARQLPDGGFCYWPGQAEAHQWVSSMAGEVLCEARRQGFEVHGAAVERWVEYQKNTARHYRHSATEAADLVQAYRLYTLCLAGDTPSAAMNKLREEAELSRQALLCLGAAYAVAGRHDAAQLLMERASAVQAVAGGAATFYSPLRDAAIELLAWATVGHAARATEVARQLARQLNPTLCSTQELAWAAAAMDHLGQLMGEAKGEIEVREEGHTPIVLRNVHGVEQLAMHAQPGRATVVSRGNGAVAVQLASTHQPAAREAVKAQAEGLTLDVGYTDLQGRPIAVDTLAQGQMLWATLRVQNTAPTRGQMALSLNLPSGWEVAHHRLAGEEQQDSDYMDIRDHRVCWYFGLESGQSRTYRMKLRAAWCGRFTLPPAVCEEMYSSHWRASSKSQQVWVVK